MKYKLRESLLVITFAITLVLCPLTTTTAYPIPTGILGDSETTTNYTIYYTDDDPASDHFVSQARVLDFGNILEEIRAMYVGWGFNPPQSPMDVFIYWIDYVNPGTYGLNALAWPDKMAFDSYFLGNTNNYGSVTVVENHTIPAHELLHTVQRNYPVNTLPYPDNFGGQWVLEGQARCIQDKVYDFTDQADGTEAISYLDEVEAYLGNPSRSLTSLSYEAVLFWAYATEQYGLITDEPQRGVDLLVEFWEVAESPAFGSAGDPVAVFDQALINLGHTGVTFEDVYSDFVVANYAKDLSGPNVPDKYHYLDESQPPGSYRLVEFNKDETPADGDPTNGHSSLLIWTPQYIRFKCDHQTSNFYKVEVTETTNDGILINMLVVKNDDILIERRVIGSTFSSSFYADADEIVLVLSGLDNNQATFAEVDYSISSIDTQAIDILNPLEVNPAYVGDHADPDKFLIIADVNDGSNPIIGLSSNEFDVEVGGVITPVLSSAFVMGLYFLEVKAPVQTTGGSYDLTVSAGGVSDVEVSAVIYSDDWADSIVVIDKSGSMTANDKIDAAKAAARLYVNSFDTPELLGLVEFNETARLLHPLGDVSTYRTDILNLIDAIIAWGRTTVGGGMLEAQNELYLNSDPTHKTHIVLLTDGRENEDPEIQTIRPLISGNNTVMDVVLIGDDAQVGLLQAIAQETGGSIYFAMDPASGTLATDLASIYRSVAEDVQNQYRIYSSREEKLGTWTAQDTFLLDQVSDASAVFSYRCETSLEFVNPYLLLPDFSTMTPTYFREHQSGVSGDYYGHFVWKLPTPDAGQYRINITASGDVEYFFEVGAHGPVSIRMYSDIGMTVKQIGERVPIIVSLVDNAPIIGADVVAEIMTGKNYTNTRTWDLKLYDDGGHGDGLPDDGVYGNYFTRSMGLGLDINQTGITFMVKINATGFSDVSGDFRREMNGAFHLVAPADWDDDMDGLPNRWEESYGLDPMNALGDDGASGDPDQDGLNNLQELDNGTSPTNSDTDGGGENDYSEVLNGRDPFYMEDDFFYSITKSRGICPQARTIPENQNVTIIYTMEPIFSNLSFTIYRSQEPDRNFGLVVAGLTGNIGYYIDDGVTNDQMYYYKVVSVGPGGERSGYSTSVSTTPKVDVTPPFGSIMINNGDKLTNSIEVVLDIYANPDAVEFRISNNPRFDGASWVAIGSDLDDRPWTLDGEGKQTVYAQFRDASGNIGGHYNGSYAFSSIIVDLLVTAPTTTGPTTPTVTPFWEEWLPVIVAGVIVLTIVLVIVLRRR